MYASSRSSTRRPPRIRPEHGSRGRAVAVWGGVSTAMASVAALALPEAGRLAGTAARGAAAPVGAPATGFAELLVGVCAVGALVAAAWLWLVTTDVAVAVVTGGDVRGRLRAGGRAATVGALRGLVIAACGATAVTVPAVAATASTASAVQAEDRDRDDQPRSERRVLDGLPLPDRAVGGPPASARDRPAGDRQPRASEPPERVDQEAGPDQPAGPDEPREPDEPDEPVVVVVRAGDCLWTIAAERLAAADDPAEVAAYSQHIHEANAEVIGDDPDLIHPGQLLQLPPVPGTT